MKLFKLKNFKFILIARLVSTLGTTMQSFVLALYVLNLTGSATRFASILFVAYIPAIVLSPIAGVYVDKMDKKKILIGLDLVSGCIVGIYTIMFSMNGEISLSLIYLLVFALAIINALYIPAIFAILPLTIDKDYLVNANSVMSFVLSTCTLLAPAIAGALYSLLGVGIILLANASSFFLSAICALCITFKTLEVAKTDTTDEKTGFWHEFKEGFLFIKTKPIFIYIVVLAMVMNLTINGVLEVGVPFVLKQVLLVKDAEYGLLQSVAVASTLLAPILFAYLCKKKDVLIVLYYVVITMASVSVISIALVSSSYIDLCPSKYIPYLTVLTIASSLFLAETIGSLCLFTIFQKNTPENLMGRVGTLLNSCASVTTPIGVIMYGFMFDHFTASICFVITSFATVVFAMYSRKVLLSKENSSEPVAESV